MKRRQTAGSRAGRLTRWRPGLWRLALPGGDGLLAGVTDRSCDLEGLRGQLTMPQEGFGVSPFLRGLVLAEQVHGASLAAIRTQEDVPQPIPGCDGLVTRRAGLALVIRTADCLPITVWDSVQRVAGLIHAGWRGVASHLPLRVIGFLQRVYHSRPEHLWVGIGPAIRSCCYEVGREFEPRFGRFVQKRRDRLVCDLIGCAVEQLVAGGVRASHVVDTQICTACEPARWYSVRREGQQGGRLLSFAMIEPARAIHSASRNVLTTGKTP